MAMSRGPADTTRQGWREWLGLAAMSPRERALVLLGGALLAVVAFSELVVMPLWRSHAALSRAVEQRQAELSQLVQLQGQYRALQQAAGRVRGAIGARHADFSLFAFVERQAEQAGARRQLGYIRPLAQRPEQQGEGEVAVEVEVRLERIGLEPLVRFLTLVESKGDAVFIRRIVIEESGGSGLLDASLQVATFEKAP